MSGVFAVVSCLGLAALTASGCTPEPTGGQGLSSDALVQGNGLVTINGLSAFNGLAMGNGLSAFNGLASFNGLATTNGLLTSADGRNTVAYLVRCALPADRTISKTVNGTTYKFAGSIGLAPEWETGACDRDCQEKVSACMLALVNTTGVHVPLWLTSSIPEIGWTQKASYPDMEGAFFGNIFVTDASGKVPAYFCEGETHVGLVPGRIGADQTNSPYRNPWGNGGLCTGEGHCDTTGVPSTNGRPDGFASCHGYPHVVTVWRSGAFQPKFEPTTKYSIKNVHSGKVIDWDKASSFVQQWTNYGTDNQLWKFVAVDDSTVRIASSANENRCLEIMGGSGGVSMIQVATCAADNKNQRWNVATTNGRKPESYGQFFKFHSAAVSGRYLEVPEQSDSNGTGLTADDFGPQDNELWRLSVAP